MTAIECRLVREDSKVSETFATILLPAVPRPGEYLWVRNGAEPARFSLLAVEYDATEEGQLGKVSLRVKPAPIPTSMVDAMKALAARNG